MGLRLNLRSQRQSPLLRRHRLWRIGLFEFHRAADAIALGEEAGEHALAEIRAMLATLPRRV